MTTIICSSWC
uniref:Uncharacterized protein n=1 Tax=Rhizophora mucronata TaxID=61149 RepID=A0A2P2N409_RHIMU